MNRNQKIKLYLFIVILVMGILFPLLLPRLSIPFGFAYIVYLMSKPMAVRLTSGSKKQRLTFTIVTLTGTLLLLFPLIVTFYNVDTNFESFLLDINRTQIILYEKFHAIQSNILTKFGIRLNIDPAKMLMSKLETHGLSLINQFPEYLSVLFEWMLLVPLFLYFFFIESHKLKIRFLEIIPNPIFEKTYVLFSQFNTKFGEYIIAKFIEATLLGLIVTLGLLLIGFPYPFILGLFAGITNILPYIGPFLGAIPGLLIALLSNDPNVSLVGILVIFTIANLVDMILVFPLLVSKIVNLHPLLVVVSIMIGSQIAGVLGMVVIIPFIAFFKLLFKEIYKDLSVHL